MAFFKDFISVKKRGTDTEVRLNDDLHCRLQRALDTLNDALEAVGCAARAIEDAAARYNPAPRPTRAKNETRGEG